jgi:hypothetical protein
MKRLHLILLVAAMAGLMIIFGFKSPEETKKEVKWLQITVVESVIPGGMGRSRMVSIDNKGDFEEVKINNFFSMVGINFKNIRENDQTVTNKIQELSNDGWELKHVVSGAFSGNEGNQNGIFLTRYLLSKEE